jgi:hypothetical protein
LLLLYLAEIYHQPAYERELAASAESAARYWYYGAGGAGLLGLVLLVIGIVN